MDLAVHAKQYKHYTIEAKNVKKKTNKQGKEWTTCDAFLPLNKFCSILKNWMDRYSLICRDG